MSEQHVEELLPAYALGSLDPEDELRVARHLAHCPRCQESLRAYEIVVADLALSVMPSAPPPALRQSILDGAHRENTTMADSSQGNRLAKLQNVITSVPAWGWVGLALIVVLAVSNILLWRQLQNRPSPGTLLVEILEGTAEFPQAEGLLVLNQGATTGTLIVDQLPLLDEGHEYQLWLIQGEARTSGGLFSVDDEGYGRLYVHLPAPLVDYSGLGVTIEPAGGSPQPTGPKVIGVDL